MAHFAMLDENNFVTSVVVVNNTDIENLPFPESEPVGIAYLQVLFPDKKWAQTSYNNKFRVRYAGVGYVFYPNCTATPYGGFAVAKPYENWIFNEATCEWIPPIPYPNDGLAYFWDQDSNTWVLRPNEVGTPSNLTTIG